jgi:hypothetical protein
MTGASTHPELDKLQSARAEGSEAVGSFIEWLGEHGYTIARWERPTSRVEPALIVSDGEPALIVSGLETGAVLHFAVSRRDAALCGASPQSLDENRDIQRWECAWSRSSIVGRLTRASEHICGKCLRMYEAGEWPERESDNPQLFSVHKPIERWLAEYFGIDLDKVEAERAAILAELQERNAGKGKTVAPAADAGSPASQEATHG